jgi:hypothetical protein
MGLDRVHEWLARARLRERFPKLTLAPYVLIVGIFTDLLIVHYPTLNRWLQPPVRGEVSDRYHLSTLSYGYYNARFPRMHLGSRGCYEAMTFTPAGGLWTGDEPQVRWVHGTGELLDFTRTTNRFFMRVRMAEPGRVLVNQNHAPGFHSSVGTVVAHEGMLALELPKGEHRIEVRYFPATLVPGALLSLLGVALAPIWWRMGPLWVGRGR